MNLAGIASGTVVHVDTQRQPEPGDIVVAHVAHKGSTIKRWREERRGAALVAAWLDPESDDHRWQATPVDEDVTISGVVVALEQDGVVRYDIPKPPRATISAPVATAADMPFYKLAIPDDSMDQAGLWPRAEVRFEKRPPANGDLVVTELDGSIVVRRYKMTRSAGGDGRPWLMPESSNVHWQPVRVEYRRKVRQGDAYVEVTEPGATVLGVVTATRANGATRRHVPKPELPGKALPPMRYRVEAPPELAPVVGGDRQLLPPLAQVLWEAQAKIGCSPWDFARILGVHVQELEMIERGHVPERKTLARIAARMANVLGEPITLEQLMALGRQSPFFERESE